MIEYKGLIMIAIIYSGSRDDGNAVGMRIYDMASGSAVDTSIQSVENNLRNGRTICNLRIDDLGHVEATGNDRLMYYAGLDFRTRKINSAPRYVTAYTDNCILCIDWNGTCKKLDAQGLADMVRRGEIANFQYAKEFLHTKLKAADNKWYKPVIALPKGSLIESGGNIRLGTEIFEGNRKLRVKAKSLDKDKQYNAINWYPSNNFIILFTGTDRQLILYDTIDNVNNVTFSYLMTISKKEPKNEINNVINAEDIIYIDKKLSVTSSEIVSTPGILSKKMEEADNNWINRFGRITGSTVGVLMVARKLGVANGNCFTLVIWQQFHRKIGVIDFKVNETLMESLTGSIFPFKLDSQSERIINEIDQRFSGRIDIQIGSKPKEPILEDLICRDRLGVYSGYSALNIKKGLKHSEMIRDIMLIPMLIIDDNAIKNSRLVGNRYLYVCSINNVCYSVYTELSPDEIKRSLEGKIMMGGFSAYFDFKNTDTGMYNVNELGLTYQRKNFGSYPNNYDDILYLDQRLKDPITNRADWKIFIEDRAMRYVGYIGYERVFNDKDICYKAEAETLNILRESVTASYVNNKELIVFVGEYRITYDLGRIKNSIESEKLLRDKVQSIQNMNMLIGLDEIDRSGYILFNNPYKVNNYYRDKPLIVVADGLAGIRANNNNFCISELCTNRKLEFHIGRLLEIGNLRLDHGAETTLMKIVFSGNIEFTHLDCAERFKLDSQQYYRIISDIACNTFKDSHFDLELSHDAKVSLTNKEYMLNFIKRQPSLAYNYIRRLSTPNDFSENRYYNLKYYSILQGKSNLVAKAILTKLDIQSIKVEDERTLSTIVGYSYLLAVTAALLSGEDDVIYLLNQLIDKEKILIRFKPNNLLGMYQKFNQNMGGGYGRG